MAMKDLDDVVVESLDGVEKEILPYIPYILQDLWSFGAIPGVVVRLAKTYIAKDKIRVLDLGCGKGAVSVQLAKELNCSVKGVDAMADFIESARNYAFLNGVQDDCDFVQGDIRVLLQREEEELQYDIVVLGAIGPVLGDMYQTLMSLRPVIKEGGVVIIDDAYIADESNTEYDRCLRKTEFYKQIEDANFAIAREVIFTKGEILESELEMAQVIKSRIHELVEREPQKKELFLGYLASQEYEFEVINHELVTGTWLLKQV